MIREVCYEDRIYFAGFFDGEGSVGIYHKDNEKVNSYSLVVGFGITYKKTLVDIQKLFGSIVRKQDMEKRKVCPSVLNRVDASPDKYKQLYNYSLNGRDALYFLKVIAPFCREKKEQVALGIKFEEGRRSHPGSRGRSESETKRCDFFYKELRRMKHEQQYEPELEIDFNDDQQSLFSFVEEV